MANGDGTDNTISSSTKRGTSLPFILRAKSAGRQDEIGASRPPSDKGAQDDVVAVDIDLSILDGSTPTASNDIGKIGIKTALVVPELSSSLDTSIETTTDEDGGSCPSQQGAREESFVSDAAENEKHPDHIAQKRQRQRRLFAIVGVAIALLMIILVVLGATGHFQNVSNTSTPGGASVVGTGAGTGDVEDTTETDIGDSHDTDEPDVPADMDTNATTTGTQQPNEPGNEGTSSDSTVAPMATERPVTYVPGLLTVEENGLLLSEGLTSRIIAERRRPVQYANGELSDEPFHRRPDYGACFAVPPTDTENEGGWVYVSNSELSGPPSGQGGVGALHFDKDGQIVAYHMLLTNTTRNCAGGRTPWETFVSCEEVEEVGQVYQVDPFNRRPPERITVGMLGGRYESFAYDDRNKSAPRFFVTEDLKNGPTVRWTPDPKTIDWDDPWNILTGNGTLEYLFLKPDKKLDNDTSSSTSGTFEWIRNLTLARENAALHARGTEGIDRNGSFLYFVCKTDKLFYILDLDKKTFVMHPANIGLFDGEPDQMKRIVNDTQDILYFTEGGSGAASGIHGRSRRGEYFTILEGGDEWDDEETTGLAFSPNGLHMYFAFQDPGVLFDITRTDGYPFHGLSLDVHYHNPPPRPLDHYLLL